MSDAHDPEEALTDAEEWLQPDAVHDEVVVDVVALALQLQMVVTPNARSVHLDLTVDGTRASHAVELTGPPTTNWDRMAIGGVEWRMVEPLQSWDLSINVPDANLRAYLSFTGTTPPTRVEGGYEQLGTMSGQVQLEHRRRTVTATPSRRTHLWK